MFQTLLLVFASFSVLADLSHGQNVKVCNEDTMNMCRNNVDDVVLGNGNTRKMELEDQCWRVRQNFDCLLWQTSMCLSQEEQEKNANAVLKAWRFLEGFCEKFTNWWTKPCYRTEDLKRCENRLSSKSRNVDKGTCRNYLDFRDCATSAVESSCDSDDQRLLSVFLMEKGQQRAWKCPRDERNYRDEPINAPLASDTGDVMYSDSGSCVFRAANEAKSCFSDFEGVQKMAREIIDEETRKEKVCCGLVKYEACFLRVLENSCGVDAGKELPNMVHNIKSKVFYNCEEHTKDTCSSASFVGSTGAILLFGFVLSFVATLL